MYIKETDNFLHRVRQALCLPVRTRCAELTVLFDRGSIIELQNFFPLLVDHIFGPQCLMSWGLRNTSENHPDEFMQLQHFLSPNGPLFKLIYILLKDPCAKYDFPLTYLPTKIRNVLQSSQIHPFYSDLLNIHPQTKQVLSLALNPFDYYMFHFAYHLINPYHQRTSQCANQSWNTVYYALCCDYIVHFLPTEPGAHVSPVINYGGKIPVQTMQEIRRPMPTSKLINAKFLNKSLEDYKYHQNLDKHPRNENWRSETVLTAFVDMWFNNDQISQTTTHLNNSFNSSPIASFLHYNELPTGEYMRIVRVLLKQIHAFSISGKADDTHLGELKKVALPMIHAKFYAFLRNLIHRWPLDGSFRLVLELWLTYIQPWRYTPDNIVHTRGKNNVNPDADDISLAPSKSVEVEYLPFIAENLLVYVVIFQQLLPRFSRVDLVSPKMALMLYRITKVFSQPNLTTYLREVEQCVENNHSPSHAYNPQWANSLPPLSPTSNWSSNISIYDSPNKSTSPHKTSFFTNGSQSERKWSGVIRQKIYELEGPNFYYKPLFSSPPASEVYDLMYLIKKSIKIAEELVCIKQQEQIQKYSGIFGHLRAFFESPNPSPNDEFTLNDRLKVPIYLEHSLQNLMDIFQITEIHDREIDASVSTASTAAMDLSSDDLSFLTPTKVRQRAKKIKYDGDPDLLPVQSYEVLFLVRAFYQLSLKINEEFHDVFYRYYYQDTYLGRMYRQILQPPLTVYRYDKTKAGSPRVSQNLLPRISLRYFASYKFLTYFIVGALINNFILGYGFTTYLLVLLFIYMLYICIKAIPKNSVRHSYPTEGFGNISFNDSF